MSSMISRGIYNSIRLIALTLLSVNLFIPNPAGAQAPSGPPNIILIVADDLSWNDLPYFSKPEYKAAYPTDFPDSEESDDGRRGEPGRIRPDRNRFPARALADPANGDFGNFRRERRDLEDTPDEYQVAPIDQNTGYLVPGEAGYEECVSPTARNHFGLCSAECPNGNCADGDPNNDESCCSRCCIANPDADPTFSGNCCDPSTDVLRGFGGLTRLANEGTTFSRFYANSSKCGPSRAALFSGRYPRRLGTTLNGGELSSHVVTIAEFLKQGCNDSGTPPNLAQQVFDGSRYFPSPCYYDEPNASPSRCAGKPCYRTGLIGKWHLGNRDKLPSAQGFDEYFGFGGASRAYWRTAPLNCSPAPPVCSNGTTLCTDGGNECPVGKQCQTDAGLYLGPKQSYSECWEAVNSDDDNPNCCTPSSTRGKYNVKKLLAGGIGKGKDQRRKSEYPCSNDGLAVDAQCVYSTRVYRDQARNFIIRNSDRQPYFLTVALHAPHFGFSAPLRTKNHYETPKQSRSNRLKAHRPNKATDYWGIIEEMDAAVGEILAVLDKTKVCSTDPRDACTSACAGECMEIGRCSNAPHENCDIGSPPSGCGTCAPQADNTIVLFTSDHGRPHGGSDYGDPKLRGGKGDTFEGGLQVGLLAKIPWREKVCIDPAKDSLTSSPTVCEKDGQVVASCASGEVCQQIATTTAIGSIVDIYATAADAAGYVLPSGGTHYEVYSPRLCGGASGSAEPCFADADCTGETCDAVSANRQVIDGRSLLSNLRQPATTPSNRNFVYGSYPGDGIVAVSAGGLFAREESDNYYATGTCIYDSRVNEPSGSKRRVEAGSCEICDPEVAGSCSGSPTKWCKLPEGVCIDAGYKGASGNTVTFDCMGDGSICIPDADDYVDLTDLVPNGGGGQPGGGLFRCRATSDCPANFGEQQRLKCEKRVWVPCNTCIESTWKLISTAKEFPPSGPGSTPQALFDVRSNPTEDAGLNFHWQGCSKVNGAINETSDPKIFAVQDRILLGNSADPSIQNKLGETAANLQQWYDDIGASTETGY